MDFKKAPSQIYKLYLEVVGRLKEIYIIIKKFIIILYILRNKSSYFRVKL